jgi:hypothetical protein
MIAASNSATSTCLTRPFGPVCVVQHARAARGAFLFFSTSIQEARARVVCTLVVAPSMVASQPERNVVPARGYGWVTGQGLNGAEKREFSAVKPWHAY